MQHCNQACLLRGEPYKARLTREGYTQCGLASIFHLAAVLKTLHHPFHTHLMTGYWQEMETRAPVAEANRTKFGSCRTSNPETFLSAK